MNRKLVISLVVIIVALASVAVFWHQTASNQPPTVDYWILSVTASGGYVNPNGTIHVPLNQTGISVTATAAGWNMFADWTFDGEKHYDAMPTITIGTQPANSSHTLEANFYIGLPPFFDITRGNFSIDAGSYKVYNFSSPSGSIRQVLGDFEASGNGSNNIRVYIMNSTSFDIWQKGGNATSYYDSGEAAIGNISIDLDSGGIFFLIYDNTSDASSPKSVTTHVYYWYDP